MGREINTTKRKPVIPPILYKYMSLERFLEHFNDYLDGKVYFADRDSLNDPMEAIPLPDRLDNSYIKSAHETQNEYNQRIREWEGCFEELEKVKICSMSATADNFAMWSYYADEHKGICIGFEIDESLLKQESVSIAKVRYINEIPVVEYHGKFTQELRENIFCRKMQRWKHEQEWRLLASGKAQMLKVGKVREVLLGSKCPSVVDRCFIDKQQPDLQNLVKRAVIEQPTGKGWSIYVSKNGIEHPKGVFSSHEWQYKIDEQDITILCFRGEQEKVKVPSFIHRKPVVAINFNGRADILHFFYITSVIIPEGIIRIEDNAFQFCTTLKSITMPDSLTHIGDSAFKCCKGLVNITIPKNVVQVGDNAFESCTDLTSVIIGDGVSDIGHYAFQDCTSLVSIIIPGNVKTIGWGAFAGCTSLTSVTFLGSIESIEWEAFSEGINGRGGENLKNAYLAGGTGTYRRDIDQVTWIKDTNDITQEVL